MIDGCSTLTLSDLSDDCRRLIKGLLETDPNKRLGSGIRQIDDLVEHRWFSSIDFDRLYEQNYCAPFIPRRKSIVEKRANSFTSLRLTASVHYHKEFEMF